MAFYSIPTDNALQDQLAATLAAAAVTATTSTDISGKLPDASATTPGVFVVDRVDSNGTATPTKREYISFTGVSGTTLSGLVRGLGGSSDQEHSAGAIVEFVPDVDTAIGVYDTFLAKHTAAGAHNDTTLATLTGTQTLTNKTLTAPVITSPVIRSYDGWQDANETWAYVSATSFKIAGVDVSSKYPKGTRVKWTQTTVKYGVVASVAFSTDTTVTLITTSSYTVADATISANYFSYEANPQGFPGWFAFTPVFTGFSSDPGSAIARWHVVGNLITFSIHSANGTSNNAAYTVSAPVTATGTGDMSWQTCLGTTIDNGVTLAAGKVRIDGTETAFTLGKTFAGGDGGFTTSGGKRGSFTITYGF